MEVSGSTLLPAKNLSHELKRSGKRAYIMSSSVIVISDSSDDEVVEVEAPEGVLETTIPMVEKKPPESGNERGAESPAPHHGQSNCRQGCKRKREPSDDLQVSEENVACSVRAKKKVANGIENTREAARGQSEAEVLPVVSTPEPRKKILRVHDKCLASTPISGSSASLNTQLETPITVKYERMRSELSETKRQQEKLLSVQEELQKELKNFRAELADKKEEGCQLISVKSSEDSTLRPIVIDGSNVAMSHGNHKVFSCKGIALCIQYFQARGHRDISALVPLHRKTAEANRVCRIVDRHLLEDLETKGLLCFTPSRQLNGRRVTPYDDRFILELACRNGGVIISNDNYRDLMSESAEFKRVVENRLIMYVFAGDNFMVPEDPHGRYGPRLADVLRRDSEWSRMVSPGLKKCGPPLASLQSTSGPVRELRRSPRIARILHNTGIGLRKPSSVVTPCLNNNVTPATFRNTAIPSLMDSSSFFNNLGKRANELFTRIVNPAMTNYVAPPAGPRIVNGPLPLVRRSPRIARILQNTGIRF